jgi:hypothetical protein
MMKKNEKNETLFSYDVVAKAMLTAILTYSLSQFGWIATLIVCVVIFVAIAGYNLIQADKEQKAKEEAEAKAKAEAEAKAKDEQLAKTLEEVKALKKQLQGSKKGGENNE